MSWCLDERNFVHFTVFSCAACASWVWSQAASVPPPPRSCRSPVSPPAVRSPSVWFCVFPTTAGQRPSSDPTASSTQAPSLHLWPPCLTSTWCPYRALICIGLTLCWVALPTCGPRPTSREGRIPVGSLDSTAWLLRKHEQPRLAARGGCFQVLQKFVVFS